MMNPRNTYIKKDNEGYAFKVSYAYDRVDGKLQAVGNKYSIIKVKYFGLTWNEENIEVASREEGNNFYKNLIKEGFKKCTEEEFEVLKPFD